MFYNGSSVVNLEVDLCIFHNGRVGFFRNLNRYNGYYW
jgi:hypothetical protein